MDNQNIYLSNYGTNDNILKCQNGTKPLLFLVPTLYNEGEVIEMTLKQLRNEKGLTQASCAKYLDIPLRTYKRYESDETKINKMKYQYIVNCLNSIGFIDEEHGILSIDQIKEICSDVFKDYSIEYCYLFGSYAKNKATDVSDVDLLVGMEITGLDYFALVETLRERLHKRVDLLDNNQLNNNPVLTNEILKDGIKIYGQQKG